MWEPWQGCFCKYLHCTTKSLWPPSWWLPPPGLDMTPTLQNCWEALRETAQVSSPIFTSALFQFWFWSDSHLCLFINLILFSSLPATHLFLFPISLPISSKFSNGRPYCVGKDKPNDLEHRSSWWCWICGQPGLLLLERGDLTFGKLSDNLRSSLSPSTVLNFFDHWVGNIDDHYIPHISHYRHYRR